MVNSDDCGDSIFLDFDRKMGKEKRYETTIHRKLIDCCKTLSNSRMILLGFYTSDPYDDEGVPILRITDIQKKYSALDGALGS